MEIMFDDLNPEAQKRLLREFGVSSPEEMNWDNSPVAYADVRDQEPDDDYDEEYDFDEEDVN